MSNLLMVFAQIISAASVTRKNRPNSIKVAKMISLEKLKILTPLQKLPKNEGDFLPINYCQML